MKNFIRSSFLLFVFYSFIGTSTYAQAVNNQYFQENEALLTHLQNLNTQWLQTENIKAVDTKILEKPTCFSAHENLIQQHLILVENTLRQKDVSQLSSIQQLKRHKALDVLNDYWKKGVFPKNTFHSVQTPYFIDENNTACAVGHIMRETDALDLALTIATTCNYAYIADMPFEKELSQWADNSGFTVDELQWIQPSYGPTLYITPTINEPNCGMANGTLELSVSPGWFFYETPVEELRYVWDNGTEGLSLQNLEAGVYCVDVFDTIQLPNDIQNGSEDVLIYSECFTLSNSNTTSFESVLTHETCPNTADGSIEIISITNNIEVNWYDNEWSLVGSGLLLDELNGFPPFSIVFNGINAMIYHAEITDNMGCKAYETFGIQTQETEPYFFISSTNIVEATCNMANGQATVTHDVGVEILWSDGFVGATRTDLVAGTYTITATNAMGCSYQNDFTMDEDCNNTTICDPEPTFNDLGACGLQEYVNAFGETIFMTTNDPMIADAPVIYYDCEGNIICESGGFYAPPLPDSVCSTEDFESQLHELQLVQTIVECETITLPPLCDFSWFEPDDAYCQLDQYYNQNGDNIFIAQPSPLLMDAPNVYYDCEGSVICYAGGFPTPEPSPDDCIFYNDLVGNLTMAVANVYVCPKQFCYPNLWIEEIGACGLEEYVNAFGETIFATTNDPMIADIPTLYYDCEGNFICEAGGFYALPLPESVCNEEYNEQLHELYFIQTIKECEETIILPFGDCTTTTDFSWASEFINNDCICSVDLYQNESNEYIIFVDSDCNFIDDADAYYDCNGNWLCATNGELMPEDYCDNAFVNGLTYIENLHSCNDEDLGCGGIAHFSIQVKALFEGNWNGATMGNQLLTNGILPMSQPYTNAPWNYAGTEALPNFFTNTNIVDWVMLCLRDADGNLIDKQATLIDTQGNLLSHNLEECIVFPNASVFGEYYISVHHRGHLSIMSSQAVADEMLYDFTTDKHKTAGIELVKYQDGAWVMYGGDYDNNGIVNNIDFNDWYGNNASVGQYLAIDIDANGVVNNLDYNVWKDNRSKVGSQILTNEMY